MRPMIRDMALGAALLAALAAGPGLAQDTPTGAVKPGPDAPMDPKTREAMRAALAPMQKAFKAMAADEVVTDPTPERLAAARDLVAAMNTEEKFRPLFAMMAGDARQKFDVGLAPLTAEQHRQADQDFEAAYTDALEARQHAANEKSVVYFASRLSAEDLHEAAGFYSSDMGRQMFSSDHVRTPEESQKMGLYVMSHPAILKLFKPSMSYLQTQLADAQASQAAFQQDVQARLCISLARDRISLPSCAAPGV